MRRYLHEFDHELCRSLGLMRPGQGKVGVREGEGRGSTQQGQGQGWGAGYGSNSLLIQKTHLENSVMERSSSLGWYFGVSEIP